LGSFVSGGVRHPAVKVALLLILLVAPDVLGGQVFEVTAYCPCRRCCGRWSGGPTASGVMPVAGVTVAAPRAIPFGSRIYVPGAGWRIVQDRLSPRFDHRVDLFFASHEEALRWGKRRLLVQIVR
jgi:3D (Asp-Asp-Asp) domain-containing protein